MTTSYAERFQQKDAVTAYEGEEYGAESYSSSIWRLQRPVLEKIIRNFRAAHPGTVRLLDFACGTGRVLSALEPLVDAADGVDISKNMVALARAKCSKARLLIGNVLTEPDLIAKEYELISSFRFLLNTEPELRANILRRLRQVIRPDGWLIVNVHGNSRSLRHPAIMWRRWREGGQSNVMLNEMSPSETRQLFTDCGFEVVRQFGFGVLPPTLYRTPLRGLAQAVDRSLAGDRSWNNLSIDLLYVCRPC